jgi:ABC-type Fe3+-siderophore transport system permease subunit
VSVQDAPDRVLVPDGVVAPIAPLRRARILGAGAVLAVLGAVLAATAGWHLTQGTSEVGFADLVGLLTGGRGTPPATYEILVGSRLPRLAAGLVVGFALGVAGALFQTLARNPLASPDTLAVTGGAFFAVTAVAAFGLAVPLWASGAVAFTGGLAAAVLVIGLAGGAGTATTRLVLAGTAVALALQAATSALLILFNEETTGLFAWGSGSLNQLGLQAFRQAAPVVAAATVAGVVLARRLDLLGLGADTAAVLGGRVRSTRVTGTLLAVLLTAAAVTVAGPIGFVGLCAPVVTRLLGRLAPGLLRHAVLLPAAGITGALLVVLADTVIRALIGADAAMAVPTGVTTTIAGSVVLVLLARHARDAGPTRQPPGVGLGVPSRRRFVVVLTIAAATVLACLVVGLMGGHTWLRTGDIVRWLQGQAGPLVSFALDERAPRVIAALLAGGALALAGSLVQATSRNPLAEPGLLGITAGAGLGAVIVTGGAVGTDAMLVAATAGALASFAVVYALAWRSGLDADRLVLVGIGCWYGLTGLTAYLLLRSDPWDTPRIYTWLSGTTYGRDWDEVVPVLVAMLVALPTSLALRRELDLLALDDDTPRLVGVTLERTRRLVLGLAALLGALSVAAVGVVAFVGLVAPHLARALVGGRHLRTIPAAVLIGAALLGLADLVGRTAIAPAQLPAGLLVALLGAPYFVYLLARSRP